MLDLPVYSQDGDPFGRLRCINTNADAATALAQQLPTTIRNDLWRREILENRLRSAAQRVADL